MLWCEARSLLVDEKILEETKNKGSGATGTQKASSRWKMLTISQSSRNAKRSKRLVDWGQTWFLRTRCWQLKEMNETIAGALFHHQQRADFKGWIPCLWSFVGTCSVLVGCWVSVNVTGWYKKDGNQQDQEGSKRTDCGPSIQFSGRMSKRFRPHNPKTLKSVGKDQGSKRRKALQETVYTGITLQAEIEQLSLAAVFSERASDDRHIF